MNPIEIMPDIRQLEIMLGILPRGDEVRSMGGPYLPPDIVVERRIMTPDGRFRMVGPEDPLDPAQIKLPGI